MNKSLTARAAFVDTRTGNTHGWTEGTGTIWSEETKRALVALVELMELDLSRLHFLGMPEAPSNIQGMRTEPGGLGEHLTDDDAPSV